MGNKGLSGNTTEELASYHFANLDVEVDTSAGDMCHESKAILSKYLGKGKCMKIAVKERSASDTTNHENSFKENPEDLWPRNKLKNTTTAHHHDDCEDKKI